MNKIRLMLLGLLFACLPAFAAQTVPLPAAQTAATSADIVITTTGTVTLFGAPAGVYLPVSLPIYAVANSTEVYIGNSLTPAKPTLTLPAGTYRLKRVDVTAFGYNLGVVLDLPSAASVSGAVSIDQTTPGTTNGVVVGSSALPTGAAIAAKQAALGTAGTPSTDVITVQGAPSMTPLLVSSAPSASTGWASYYSANVTNTAVAVDASPGSVGWIGAMNNNATVCYLQFFNLAQGSVTVGTTTPLFSQGIPANGGGTIQVPAGLVFTTAVTVAVTTTRSGSTACTSGMDLSIAYK